jgi:hypothetical protein
MRGIDMAPIEWSQQPNGKVIPGSAVMPRWAFPSSICIALLAIRSTTAASVISAFPYSG